MTIFKPFFTLFLSTLMLSQSLVTVHAQELSSYSQLKQALQLAQPQIGFTRQPANLNYQLGPKDWDGYTLDTGDLIQVRLWNTRINLSYSLEVDAEGQLAVPRFKRLEVRGHSLLALKKQLKKRLSKTLKDPVQVDIQLKKRRQVQVQLSGFVQKPGYYQVPWGLPVLEVIRLAGGIKDNGSVRRVHFQAKGEPQKVLDLMRFQMAGKVDSNPPVLGGEHIHIPGLKSKVALVGEISQAGLYEIGSQDQLSDLFSLAGGLKPLAMPEQFLYWPAGLLQSQNPPKMRAMDAPLSLKHGDVLFFLPRRFPTEDKVVHILGQVNQAGSLPFREGLSLQDCLNHARGPKDNADLSQVKVSRQSKGKTEVFIVNLDSQLFNAGPRSSFRMQAGDIILIPERFFNIKNFTELTTLLLSVLGVVSVVINLSRTP